MRISSGFDKYYLFTTQKRERGGNLYVRLKSAGKGGGSFRLAPDVARWL